MKIKVVVLIPYRDKETRKIHNKGDIIEVTVKRFNEITAKGKYIQPVEETATAKG